VSTLKKFSLTIVAIILYISNLNLSHINHDQKYLGISNWSLGLNSAIASQSDNEKKKEIEAIPVVGTQPSGPSFDDFSHNNYGGSGNGLRDSIGGQEVPEAPKDEPVKKKVKKECKKTSLDASLKICKVFASENYAAVINGTCGAKFPDVNIEISGEIDTNIVTLALKGSAQWSTYNRCVTGAEATLKAKYARCDANIAIAAAKCDN